MVLKTKYTYILTLVALIGLHKTGGICFDYQYFPGVGLYRYVPEMRTWGEAFKDCKQSGGHLLIINSQDEADTFAYIAERAEVKVNVQWLGLTDLYNTGEFYDIKGNALSETGYMNWSPNYPQIVEENHCMEMWNSTSGWGLANVNCSLTRPYVCEVEFCN